MALETLDDDLSDLIGGAPRAPVTVPAGFKPVAERLFSEPCPKCRGSGRFVGYTGRVLGSCFEGYAMSERETFQLGAGRKYDGPHDYSVTP